MSAPVAADRLLRVLTKYTAHVSAISSKHEGVVTVELNVNDALVIAQALENQLL